MSPVYQDPFHDFRDEDGSINMQKAFHHVYPRSILNDAGLRALHSEFAFPIQSRQVASAYLAAVKAFGTVIVP